jgi:hypothetical protein
LNSTSKHMMNDIKGPLAPVRTEFKRESLCSNEQL